MGDFVFRDAYRLVGGVVRFEDPVGGVRGEAFDRFGAVGGGAEFREVGDEDLAVAAGGRWYSKTTRSRMFRVGLIESPATRTTKRRGLAATGGTGRRSSRADRLLNESTVDDRRRNGNGILLPTTSCAPFEKPILI